MPSRTPAKARPRSPLKGCSQNLRDAKSIGVVDPAQQIEVTVLLRSRTKLPRLRSNSQPRKTRSHLSQAGFGRHYSASAADIAKIRTFAARHNLAVVESAPHCRTLVLAGPAKSIAQAFSIEFNNFNHPDGHFFAPTQIPSVPGELKGIVETVLGFQNRCIARRRRLWSAGKRGPSRSMLDLAEAYAFPKDADGSGQTIALIELGGGFRLSDIRAFCSRLNISPPKITTVEVRGTRNHPAPVRDVRKLIDFIHGKCKLSSKEQSSPGIESAQSTVEVTMDIEILAALAPGAHIVVYFSTPDEQGIYHAITQAIHDTVHRPDILSISWGEPEISLSDAYIRAIDEALLTAAHLGITVLASAGDAGALNNSPDRLPTVNFPASSSWCIACGGTTPKPKGKHAREEIVWNSTYHGVKGATGGGISRKFPLPLWQKNARVPLGPTGKPGRGVPDVAGPADPRYGSEFLVAGATLATAGTSAVVPFWAALIARCNQALDTRCGYFNPELYRLAQSGASPLHPVTKGNNDGYRAHKGWNPCTGYGTPHGEDLIRALR